MESKIKITNNPICAECPCKIYADDKTTIAFGRGNIVSGKIIILPQFNQKSLEIIIEQYLELTGRDIYEDCYVTALQKCYIFSDIPEKKSAEHCTRLLTYEIGKINPRKLLFLGFTYDHYCNNCKVNVINGKVITAPNPLIFMYNNQKFITEFTERLREFAYDS